MSERTALPNAPVLATKLYCYDYNLCNDKDAKEYAAFCAQRKAEGVEVFATLTGKGSHYTNYLKLHEQQITLETDHVFSNQWNTGPISWFNPPSPGYRVFDWAEDAGLPNPNIKRGHWLIQTDEMRETRAHRLICGYCGAQYDARREIPERGFCQRCLSSEYLEVGNLPLLRLTKPELRRSIPPLTAEEVGWLMPLYRRAQSIGITQREQQFFVRFRSDLISRCTEEIEKAQRRYTTEMKGKLWLLDQGARRAILSNVIYYDHVQTWCFGWSKPIAEGSDDFNWLIQNLAGFPGFPYKWEIKIAGGKVRNMDGTTGRSRA